MPNKNLFYRVRAADVKISLRELSKQKVHMKVYGHFTLNERKCLAKLLLEGKNHAEIARILVRHRSNIGREIRQNRSQNQHFIAYYVNTA